MSSRVWMSSVHSNYALGDKPGVRIKYYGYDWQPAEFRIPLASDEVYANMRKAAQGFALKREELPEAAAVWNERRFELLGDVFFAGGFIVVRGELAKTLSRFDLGAGGLVPFSVRKADLETPYPDEFFLLNFGCRKDAIVLDCSRNVIVRGVTKDSGMELLRVNSWSEDGDLALSNAALGGPDLWYEQRVDNKIFMSDTLAQAISDIGLKDTFALKECRIVGEPL